MSIVRQLLLSDLNFIATVMALASRRHDASPDLNLLEAFNEKHHRVEFFRFYWLDLTGTTRVRIVTRSMLLRLTASKSFIGVGASVLSMLQSSALNGSEEFGAVGQFDLVPDMSSLRLCGFAKSHASLMCSFAQGGKAIDMSPRVVLNKLLQESAQQGLQYLFGFELEFTMINKSLDLQHAFPPEHTWSGAKALSGRPLEILESIVRSLQHSDIEVQHFEAEGGPAQYEIATGPLPALAAVDSLVHSRETIRSICEKNLAVATFHPKLKSGASGTGAHVHFSFDKLTEENHFIAGILAHLPSICAFTLPTVISYDRLLDSGWSGGTWVAWGTQNRETPLRKIAPGRWEFKSLDGTANMYLALAAVIAAGLLGVAERLELKCKDCQGKQPFHPVLIDSDLKQMIRL